MKVAVYQSDIFFNKPNKNIKKFYNRVKDLNIDLIVLPELFTTGYKLSKKQIENLSEPIPSSDTVSSMKKISKEINCAIVWGMSEYDIENGKYYNSSVLVNKGDYIGKYRKIHLFLNEKDRFSPGDLGFPVWDINGYKIGMMVCFDWIFPEAARTLSLNGAEIIAHPANLVLPYCQKVLPTRSMENRVFIASSNRIGTEDDLVFTGKSVITNPKGEYLEKAGLEDKIIIADIDITESRNKNITERNNIFEDRRPNYYK